MENWVNDLEKAREIKIPRSVYGDPQQYMSECYLHGFGDASRAAYCAVVYSVYKTCDEYRHVRMLASKSRVAPLKSLTIPIVF